MQANAAVANDTLRNLAKVQYMGFLLFLFLIRYKYRKTKRGCPMYAQSKRSIYISFTNFIANIPHIYVFFINENQLFLSKSISLY